MVNMSEDGIDLPANALSVTLVHMSNGTNAECIDKHQYIGNELRRTLKRLNNVCDAKLKSFKMETRPNDKYYEDSDVCRYNGYIECESLSLDGISKVLTNICEQQQPLSGTWISLTDSTIARLTKQNNHKSQIVPRHKIVKDVCFQFGTIVDLTSFIKHFDSNNQTNDMKMKIAKNDITADFRHDKKELVLSFRQRTPEHNNEMKNIRYKLKYPYSSFISVVTSVKKDNTKLYINLSHPPFFYICVEDLNDGTYNDANKDYLKKRYGNRYYTNKHKPRDIKTNDSFPSYIRENFFEGCDAETIGKCNVLALDLPLIKDKSKIEHNYVDLPDPWNVLYMLNKITQIPLYFASITEFNSIARNDGNSISLPFSVAYAYEAVFCFNFQPLDELMQKNQLQAFNEKIVNYAKEKCNEKVLSDSLFELSAIVDRFSYYRTLKAFDEIFEEERRKEKKFSEINTNSFDMEIQHIRRCILTPSRLLILPPLPTLQSRFIVKSEPDYTIRLSMREDDLQGLSYSLQFYGRNHEKQLNFLRRIIRDPILGGIVIGGRKFEFFGSSSSQLRDGGMVLYAEDTQKRTAETIRDSIGDMSEYLRNVPKFVSRLGLALSQAMTHVTIDLSTTAIDVIDDIEGAKKPDSDERYIFSDGIGKIDRKTFGDIYQNLKQDCYHEPCAVQIRYGGCKGMLVLDPTLDKRHIIFRKSMEKYKCDDHFLGVLKLSAPRPLYLNRPFITILEQLKVHPKIFLRMLLQNLSCLANSLVCECAAHELLQNSSTLSIPYLKLYECGVPFLSEPLFRQIVECVIQHRIKELKTKARIKLPMDCGRNVMGVLDEYNILKYGEVFIQISKMDSNNMPIKNKLDVLEGEVMVTKFPCLHPGDVRKFKAVDVPQLRHIKDCIVFPAQGDRPHPDEMAGSDLDGDEYAIIWNSELIFKGENKQAMQFPSIKGEPLDHDLTISDILDFYCRYILDNNVGLIANAHLVFADLTKLGIFHPVCNSLALKYSIALDFPKTGADVSRHTLAKYERPFIYPNFMEKYSEKRTYLSKNVLGQIYMHCCRYEMGMNSKADLEIKVNPNKDFNLNGWEIYKESAEKHFLLYRNKVNYLLNRFGVRSEAALISGAYSKSSKYMTGRTETNDVHELVESLLEKLFAEFKDKFNKDCKGSTDDERRLRASAWYMVSFTMNENVEHTYFGFPWTITEELCKIVKHKTFVHSSKDKEPHDCVRHSAEVLDKYLTDDIDGYGTVFHKEPDFDATEELRNLDENDKRAKIIENRFKTAQIVIYAWLERQDHLFFKTKQGTKVRSMSDRVMSDMDMKLKHKLWKFKCDLVENIDIIGKPLPTAGNLVMTFLKDLVNDWLSFDKLNFNNRVVDTPLVKFGFAALLTLNHFFKTRDITHIFDISDGFKVSVKADILFATIYIALPKGKSTEDFVNYMVQGKEKFIEKVKDLTGVIDIRMEAYTTSATSKHMEHCYLLTCCGTVWAIQAVKHFIAHPSFFRDVKSGEPRFKKKNLYYNGADVQPLHER